MARQTTQRKSARNPRRRPVRAAAPHVDKAAPSRREAILSAALEEFSSAGFAAARLDDVARRAGVAKGTIYLYFRDKDALFHELIRTMLTPLADAVAASFPDMPPREAIGRMVDLVVCEIFQTRRKDVIRLVLTEGARFPKLAEFYHREVLSKLFGVLRELLARAARNGELANPAIAEFPQLLGAPIVVGILWEGLFGRFAPLDVQRMLRTHFETIFVARTPS